MQPVGRGNSSRSSAHVASLRMARIRPLELRARHHGAPRSTTVGGHMNWTQIEAKWDQVKGDAKSTWSKLTDDDLTFVAGERDKLVGKVQERYGVLKEHAQKDVDRWVTMNAQVS